MEFFDGAGTRSILTLKTPSKIPVSHLSRQNFDSEAFARSSLRADMEVSSKATGVSVVLGKELKNTASRRELALKMLWKYWSDFIKTKKPTSQAAFLSQFRADAKLPRFWKQDVDNFTASIRCRARMNALRTFAFQHKRNQLPSASCGCCNSGVSGDLTHLLLACPHFKVARDSLQTAVTLRLRSTRFDSKLSLHHLLGSDFLPLASDTSQLVELTKKDLKQLYAPLLSDSAPLLRDIHSALTAQ
jgi:hypothetical protein